MPAVAGFKATGDPQLVLAEERGRSKSNDRRPEDE
jgi:hypothetical protein